MNANTGKLLTLLTSLTLLSGCLKSGYDEVTVYNSNFKSGDTTKLKGAKLYTILNEQVIGRYNNGEFELNLENLPTHKAVHIMVEPLFHDSWDGNNTLGGIDGPDIWSIFVDQKPLLEATFSNSPCNALYCLPQSYPASYGIINNSPRTESIYDLPGTCHATDIFKTSAYRIEKTVRHTDNKINIKFKDFLIQQNVADKLCDESWSVRHLVVKLIDLP